MPRSILVPGELHLERGRGTQTQRRFFDALRAELLPERRVASRAATRLGARLELDRLGEKGELGDLGRADGGDHSRAALAHAADVALGALAASGAVPDDLARTRTARGALLARLMRGVEERLDRAGLVDGRRMRPTARDREALRGAVLPSAIAVEGTVDLDGSRLQSLCLIHEELRRRGEPGVTIRLPRFEAPEHPVHALADPLERFLSISGDAPDIEWVEAGAHQATTVIEAKGRAAEARAIAFEAARALSRGFSPDRVAIVVPRSDEGLLEPLRAELVTAGVPFAEADGPPAERSPEARAAIGLLEMARGNVRRDALVELFGTPGIHAGTLVFTRDEGEARIRAARVAACLTALPLTQDGTGELFVQMLAANARKPRDASFVPGAVEGLLREIAELVRSAEAGDLCRRFVSLVERLRLGDPSAGELAETLRSEKHARATRTLSAIGEGAVAVRAVLEATTALQDARVALGAASAPLSVADLHAEILQAIGAVSTAARGGSARAGAVRVGPPREIAGLDHDVVVVGRMVASAWAPRRASGLLDEATRTELPEGVRPRGITERRRLAEAELAWALASAREIVLVYSAAAGDGRETDPPHPHVVKARASGARESIEPASRLARNASVTSPRGRELVRLAHGEPAAADLVARVQIEGERTAYFTDPSKRAGAFSGVIAPELTDLLRARFRGDRAESPLSVSDLDRAATCPFKAFSERVLGARTREDAEDAMSPRERGTLLHRALHAAFEAGRALPPSAPPEGRLAAAREAVSVALALDAPASPLRREALLLTAADAVAVFEDDQEIRGELTYAWGEQPFGADHAPPYDSLEIRGASGESVWLAGQIDRIDASPDHAHVRVIDYKSGKAPSMKVVGKTTFQLPLYALVARRLGATEVSAMYVAVARGGAVTTSPARAKVAPYSDDALARDAEGAARIVLALHAGCVEPRPADGRSCKRCDARDLCRRPVVIAERDDDQEAFR